MSSLVINGHFPQKGEDMCPLDSSDIPSTDEVNKLRADRRREEARAAEERRRADEYLKLHPLPQKPLEDFSSVRNDESRKYALLQAFQRWAKRNKVPTQNGPRGRGWIICSRPSASAQLHTWNDSWVSDDGDRELWVYKSMFGLRYSGAEYFAVSLVRGGVLGIVTKYDYPWP